ncbi:GNAT family N-acetyltransferase [Acerihabitans arboris]|uniref:GNAT family N-acetyltransferase n=1 Tax=Acerihabitans arboris TaxID=2691583 RepID=A0A845SIC9_9GAMM|nr:GNAT family N-acetyltransferase [Acerihabitans arboris]NDL64660.1 GNAT family N-acetyltransferase [Acerihabitans arboris]
MDMIVTSEPTHKDIDELRNGIIHYSAQHIDVSEIKALAIFFTDKAGNKLSGLSGSTAGNWLRIDLLWVSAALRGQGIGTRLMRAAESEAIARGCIFAQVDTTSFQARPFYEKLGYVCRMTLDNYPRVHQRYYLTKALV